MTLPHSHYVYQATRRTRIPWKSIQMYEKGDYVGVNYVPRKKLSSARMFSHFQSPDSFLRLGFALVAVKATVSSETAQVPIKRKPFGKTV